MTTYYIADSDGNDSYNGLYNSFQSGSDGPWKTITKANNTLIAGDTVYIRTGTYSTNDGGAIINPDNSGSSGSLITYENYPGEEPNLTNMDYGAYFLNVDYIKIKGLKMDNGSQSTDMETFVWFTNADHCTVENCTFKYVKTGGGAPDKGIMVWAGSDYAIIKGNNIQYVGVPQPPAGADSGDGIRANGDYALIEENFVDYCGHNCIKVYGNKCVIRDNEFVGTWGRTMETDNWDAGHVALWEGNIVHGIRKLSGGTVGNTCMQFEGRGHIVRRNVIYDGNGTSFSLNAVNPLEVHGLRIYNNVGYDLGQRGDTNYDGPADIHESGGTGRMTDCDWRNNIWYNNYADTISYWVDADPGDHNFTNNSWNATDPKFVNAPSDFHLQSNSPCRNTGTWLTLTNGSGNSSTTMIVDDAGFFCDGWGIVEGDYIQLEGQTVTSKITNINYGIDTLTLETALTWSDNVGVALPYIMSAPDKGAFEGGTMAWTKLLNDGDPITDLTGTAYRLLLVDSAGDIIELAHGTANKVLTSQGNSADPTWEDAQAGAHALDAGQSDVTITSVADDEVLSWETDTWINKTAAEAGLAEASHGTHLTEDSVGATEINEAATDIAFAQVVLTPAAAGTGTTEGTMFYDSTDDHVYVYVSA